MASVEVSEPKREMMGKFDKWEIESGLRTLQEAEEIRKDDEKMKQIQKLAKIKLKEIKSIADLRARANDMGSSEMESEEE